MATKVRSLFNKYFLVAPDGKALPYTISKTVAATKAASTSDKKEFLEMMQQGYRIRKGHVHFVPTKHPDSRLGSPCWLARHPNASILYIGRNKDEIIEAAQQQIGITWQEAHDMGATAVKRWAIIEIPPEHADRFFI